MLIYAYCTSKNGGKMTNDDYIKKIRKAKEILESGGKPLSSFADDVLNTICLEQKEITDVFSPFFRSKTKEKVMEK